MADLCNLEGVALVFAEVLHLVEGKVAIVGRGSIVDLPGTSLRVKHRGISKPTPSLIDPKVCRSARMPRFHLGMVWLHACNTQFSQQTYAGLFWHGGVITSSTHQFYYYRQQQRAVPFRLGVLRHGVEHSECVQSFLLNVPKSARGERASFVHASGSHEKDQFVTLVASVPSLVMNGFKRAKTVMVRLSAAASAVMKGVPMLAATFLAIQALRSRRIAAGDGAAPSASRIHPRHTPLTSSSLVLKLMSTLHRAWQ